MQPLLDDIKVVELAGIGPVSLAGMMLADFGADVILGEAIQQSPVPRFSRTPGRIGAPPCEAGAHSDEVQRARD